MKAGARRPLSHSSSLSFPLESGTGSLLRRRWQSLRWALSRRSSGSPRHARTNRQGEAQFRGYERLDAAVSRAAEQVSAANRPGCAIASSAVFGCARALSLVVRLSSLHRALRRPRHMTNVVATATLHVSAGSGGGNTGRRQQARSIALLACTLARCLSMREIRPGTSGGKGERDAGRKVGEHVCVHALHALIAWRGFHHVTTLLNRFSE